MPFFDPLPTPTGGLHAPATLRNREPILAVLRAALPPTGLALEIASGTGEHVAHFAQALPSWRWQPSDPVAVHLESIRAWSTAKGAVNIAPPLALDVEQRPWPVDYADAVLAINLIHIAPVAAGQALFEGSARVLRPGGVLFLYGPYTRDGEHTSVSNRQFDERLRQDDPRWGVRDVADVETRARASGFEPPELTQMPANNLSLVFRRRRP
jgi:SAM-dependent methyltransferase